MRFTNVGTAAVATVALLLLPGRPALAQNVGDRVRVTTPRTTAVGVVTEMDESGLKLLLREGWHWEAAYDDVEQLEVSMERKRSTWRGLGIGVGVGLVASLARKAWGPKRLNCGNVPLGLAIRCVMFRRRPHPLPSDTEIFATTTVLVGVTGALVGALIKRDAWETMPHESSRGLALDPLLDLRSGPDGRTGAIVGTRIRF